MKTSQANRFQDFFETDRYLTLKNHLYNYLLRKQAVEKALQGEGHSLILEAGSGISPVMTQTDRIVYSELSLTALETLKRQEGRGWYVAADITRLPFKTGSFSHALSSEVLEHIPDDREAVKELARVVGPEGELIVTFPHRKFYFAADDTFVKHFRRYELSEMEMLLRDAGFETLEVQKVLGPLDKVLMCLAVWGFALTQGFRKGGQKRENRSSNPFFPFLALCFKGMNRILMALAWVEARWIPQSWATILLLKARKSDPAVSP